jgi:hypothetical protein
MHGDEKMNGKLKIGITIALLVGFVLVAGCEKIEAGSVIGDARIVSLDLTQSTHGSFVMGSGVIGTNTYYYYYLVDDDGNYYLRKADTDNSKISMDAGNDTAYVRVSIDRKGMDLFCESKNPTPQTVDECIPQNGAILNYEFHVPPGTITKKFNADVNGE